MKTNFNNFINEKLSDVISNALGEDLSYEDFAIAVAEVLKNDYGQHNFEPFLEVLKKELKNNEEI